MPECLLSVCVSAYLSVCMFVCPTNVCLYHCLTYMVVMYWPTLTWRLHSSLHDPSTNKPADVMAAIRPAYHRPSIINLHFYDKDQDLEKQRKSKSPRNCTQ